MDRGVLGIVRRIGQVSPGATMVDHVDQGRPWGSPGVALGWTRGDPGVANGRRAGPPPWARGILFAMVKCPGVRLIVRWMVEGECSTFPHNSS